MSDRNNDQELEKTTDATADEVTSETETNDAIEPFQLTPCSSA